MGADEAPHSGADFLYADSGRRVVDVYEEDAAAQPDIIWVPAHVDHPGHEAANSITRNSTNRASPAPPKVDTRDAFLTYHDITLHYHLSRLTFPPTSPIPFPAPTTPVAPNFRPAPSLLLARLAPFHPGTYSPACRLCGSSMTNCEHIFHSCPAHLTPTPWHLRSPQH
ncbi:hypothetical protein MRX96_039979 [Rhipicephalus microplus]